MLGLWGCNNNQLKNVEEAIKLWVIQRSILTHIPEFVPMGYLHEIWRIDTQNSIWTSRCIFHNRHTHTCKIHVTGNSVLYIQSRLIPGTPNNGTPLSIAIFRGILMGVVWEWVRGPIIGCPWIQWVVFFFNRFVGKLYHWMSWFFTGKLPSRKLRWQYVSPRFSE